MLVDEDVTTHEWRWLGVSRSNRSSPLESQGASQRVPVPRTTQISPEPCVTYLPKRDYLRKIKKTWFLPLTTSTLGSALGSESLWLHSEILFLLHSIKRVCVCGGVSYKPKQLLRRKMQFTDEVALSLQCQMFSWDDLVSRRVSHSSYLEAFVPAKLVSLLVLKWVPTANILTTMRIYFYL